jgi:hypothetical protein
MTDSSRRSFLKYASLGTAAAGVAAVAPSFTSAASAATTTEPESNAAAHDGPFVAWVKDPAAGEIAVLVGEQELVYTDKKLAKKLAQAAKRAQQQA